MTSLRTSAWEASKTLFFEFKITGFSFLCGRKTFSKTFFFFPAQSCDFPDRVFLKLKSKITGDCCVKFLNSTGGVWTGPKSFYFFNSHPFREGIVTKIYSADTRTCRGGLAGRSCVHETKSRLVWSRTRTMHVFRLISITSGKGLISWRNKITSKTNLSEFDASSVKSENLRKNWLTFIKVTFWTISKQPKKVLNQIYRNNAASFLLSDRLYGLSGQKIELHNKPGRQEARNILCALVLSKLCPGTWKRTSMFYLFCVHGVCSVGLIEVSSYPCRRPAGTEKSKTVLTI